MNDSHEDHNDLDSSSSTVKTIHEFEERLDKFQLLYIREVCRFKRQMELSQTYEKILT